MSINIRRALETRLNSMSPALAAAWENAAFTPTPGTAYQRVSLLPAEADSTTLGCAYRRELGVFQVLLCYPVNGGSGTAEARADAVIAHFPRGHVMTSGGINTMVIRHPSKAPAFIEGDRYIVPVSIRYQAEILT